MTIVALTSAKHSPGVTTLAVALAALAVERGPALVVEGDPAGGDLAARSGLGLDPGLGTLAGAARRAVTAELLMNHTQPLHSGAKAVVSPTSREHAGTTLRALSGRMPLALMTSGDSMAFVDLGRWQPDHPFADVVAAATATLLVITPTVEGVEHARSRLASLPCPAANLLVIAVGERPYGADEIGRALGVMVLSLPFDRRTAEVCGAGVGLDRWLRRTPLLRSARAVLDRIVALDSPAPAPALPAPLHARPLAQELRI